MPKSKPTITAEMCDDTDNVFTSHQEYCKQMERLIECHPHYRMRPCKREWLREAMMTQTPEPVSGTKNLSFEYYLLRMMMNDMVGVVKRKEEEIKSLKESVNNWIEIANEMKQEIKDLEEEGSEDRCWDVNRELEEELQKKDKEIEYLRGHFAKKIVAEETLQELQEENESLKFMLKEQFPELPDLTKKKKLHYYKKGKDGKLKMLKRKDGYRRDKSKNLNYPKNP